MDLLQGHGRAPEAAVTSWAAAPDPAAQPTACDTRVPVSGDRWMAALPPTLCLDQLTIPGSHNAAALHGGRWAACQQMGIDEQLRAGIRYLDIRVRLHHGRFDIHHGHVFQKLTLDEVLDGCREFLRHHPTESVLLSLKQEHSHVGASQLAAAWAALRRDFPGLVHDSRRTPTVGQARGRVVLVSRDPGFPGLDQPSWQVHDDWRVDSRSLWHARKWPGITDHLRRARAARGDQRMWSCHATSNGWRLPPLQAARLLAPALTRHLDELGPRPAGAPPERNGIVLLDFVDADQPRQLWTRNL